MIIYPVYLVPCDFSEITDNALTFALDIAHANDGSVFLIHIVTDRKDKAKMTNRMNNLINKLPEEDQQRTTGRVIYGSIYEDIGKATELLRPAIVVLGTHGAKGLQNIFGSHMDKMISNSSSPLLITRGSGNSVSSINKIVMPVDFTKESLQITSFASRIAKKFNACIHLLAEHSSSEIHEDKTLNNQKIVKDHMENSGVDYKVVKLPGQASYEKEMLNYA